MKTDYLISEPNIDYISEQTQEILRRVKVEHIKNSFIVRGTYLRHGEGVVIAGVIDDMTEATLAETYVCLLIGENGACATGYGRLAGDGPLDHHDARTMAERHALLEFCRLEGISLPLPKSISLMAEHPGIHGFNWKKHPQALYIAQDVSGRWYWYDGRPVPLKSDKIWFIPKGKTGRVTALLPRFWDWEKSLLKRPEGI